MAEHYLVNVAGLDIIFTFFYGGAETLRGKVAGHLSGGTGDGGRLVIDIGVQQFAQCVYLGQGRLILGPQWLARPQKGRMADDDLLLQVVENHHGVDEHEQGVGEIILACPVDRDILQPLDGLVAEVTDQPGGERGQIVPPRQLIGRSQLAQSVQIRRVNDRFHAILNQNGAAFFMPQQLPWIDADGGVSGDLLAPFDGFEQQGGEICLAQPHVRRHGSEQIGKHLAVYGNRGGIVGMCFKCCVIHKS